MRPPAAASALAAQLAAGMREIVDLGAVVIDDEVQLVVNEVVERQRHGPLGSG